MPTSPDFNRHGQPVGRLVPAWRPVPVPERTPFDTGRFCRLEPVDPARHAEALFREFARDTRGAMWTYLFYGSFENPAEFRTWMEANCLGNDPLFFTIVDRATDRAVGLASYLRIEPRHGVMEVGHLVYSPALQRTPAATEAMFLMMERAFALGYRRYEWKCDSLNAPSRAAAQRLGFSFEGIFRQAVIVKGRNRDTAWYSIIDAEWPALRDIFRRWLDPSNFDVNGQQKEKLSALTAPLLQRTLCSHASTP